MAHRLIVEVIKATIITLGFIIIGVFTNLFLQGVGGCFLKTSECNANFILVPLLGFGLSFLVVFVKMLFPKR